MQGLPKTTLKYMSRLPAETNQTKPHTPRRKSSLVNSS